MDRDTAFRLLELAEHDPATFHACRAVAAYADYYEMEPGEALESLYPLLVQYQDAFVVMNLLHAIPGEFGQEYVSLRDRSGVDDEPPGKLNC